MLPYDEYVIESARLNELCGNASRKLQAYPHNDNGMVPDHIRESEDFQNDKRTFVRAFRDVRRFNKENRKNAKTRANLKRAERMQKHKEKACADNR